jgi:hypothetical protein
VNSSKVDPNVSIRDQSALDILELMGMDITNISSLYKKLEEENGSYLCYLLAMASRQLGTLIAG